MIVFGLRLSLALFLIVAFLAIGQVLSSVTCDILGFKAGYIQSLGSEIGGSGVDAILVGGIAGLVVSEFSRGNAYRAHAAMIAGKRIRMRVLALNELTQEWSAGLDLHGFTYSAERLEDRTLRRCRFSRRRQLPAATLSKIVFDGCLLLSDRFGEGTANACNLRDVEFVDSILKRCSFRGCSISAETELTMFRNCEIKRTNFDHVLFKNINFNEAKVVGCTFWGASFENCHLPKDIFARFRYLEAIVDRQPGKFRVMTRKEFLASMSWNKLLKAILPMRLSTAV